MANKDDPRGFVCIGSRGNYMPVAKRYYMAAGNSAATFVGSPVRLEGGADSFGVPTVDIAADTEKPVGVVVGVDQIRDVTDANFSLYRTHRPASVAMYVWVIDDPEALFVAQADDALAAADIGLNCGWTAESGNTVTGLSTVEVDSSDKATTSTLPLRIERLYQVPNNEFGANQDVVVSFNIHAYKTGYDTGETQEIGGLGV